MNIAETGEQPSKKIRPMLRNASRYGESRRMVYNLILAAEVIAWVMLTWPHFSPAFEPQPFLLLSILAVLANLCYSAAYVFDILLQYTSFRTGGSAGDGCCWRHFLQE